jgi:hypothetical protein
LALKKANISYLPKKFVTFCSFSEINPAKKQFHYLYRTKSIWQPGDLLILLPSDSIKDP